MICDICDLDEARHTREAWPFTAGIVVYGEQISGKFTQSYVFCDACEGLLRRGSFDALAARASSKVIAAFTPQPPPEWIPEYVRAAVELIADNLIPEGDR